MVSDEASVLSILCQAARRAPSADNTQPWCLTWDGEAFTARYDTQRALGKTFPPDDPATLIAFGAVLENLSQLAAAAGLVVQPAATPDDAYFRLLLSGSDNPPADLSDHALFGRHTNRLPFRTEALPRSMVGWLSAQYEGAAQASVIDASEPLARVSELVRLSSELRFRTKEVHELLGRSLRFTQSEVEQGDGLDVSTLHLPPGGRGLLRLVSDWRRMAALNRLGAYKAFAAIEAKAFGNASAAIAITGTDGQAGALEAGRLLERIWIELNRQGLAVHPFYVVADQLFRRRRGHLPAGLEPIGEQLAEQASAVLDLADETLYMLLRVGYPTRTPVKSRRLPLDVIFSTTKSGAAG